jgi:hypothetical protein
MMVLLFGFDAYYPAGALNDMLRDFDTIEEATKAVKSRIVNPHYPFDFYNLLVIAEGRFAKFYWDEEIDAWRNWEDNEELRLS